jgi:UDP-N-acetyl-D-glucosamine dehydrogenase
MSHKTTLIEKLNGKNAVIGIIGLGYVGLPLMARYHAAGYSVMGFDVDPKKIEMLRKGQSYINLAHIDRLPDESDNRWDVTTDFERIGEVDTLILCVPTPLNDYREPDLSYVLNTMQACLPYLRNGQVVSLESTTYPGTTDEELKPLIEAQGFIVGKQIFLVYSPEREDPGNKNFNTQSIPKIVGGHTPNCLEVGEALYKHAIEKVVPVSSTKAAEMTKLLENIHRAVNIGLVNEMKIVADRMGIDIYEVIDAAATKPFGFTPYYPGPGLGGHCIPIDPFYLTWKAREYGLHTRFIEIAGELNSAMPDFVINKLSNALNDVGKPIKGSKILILGLAYKKNVDDERESPSIVILDKLVRKGAEISYSDPHIPKFKKKRKFNYDFESITLSPESLKGFDAVILATDHDAFDYKMILDHANIIVDTRGKYREPHTHVVKS